MTDFWQLASKPWFFPIVYLSLGLLAYIISVFTTGGLTVFFLPFFLIFMATGLLIGTCNLTGILCQGPSVTPSVLYTLFPLGFIAFMVYTIILLQKKQIKWLIILMLILILLSFGGCVSGFIQGSVNYVEPISPLSASS